MHQTGQTTYLKPEKFYRNKAKIRDIKMFKTVPLPLKPIVNNYLETPEEVPWSLRQEKLKNNKKTSEKFSKKCTSFI